MISWLKGDSIIALGAVKAIQDERYDVQITEYSSTLIITLVNSNDAGEYICSVAVEDKPLTKAFTIEIKGDLFLFISSNQRS